MTHVACERVRKQPLPRHDRARVNRKSKGDRHDRASGLLMARLIRGLGSLAVLLLGTAGVPVALAFLGGNPLPDELTWSAMRRALFCTSRRHDPGWTDHDRRLASVAGLRAVGDQ